MTGVLCTVCGALVYFCMLVKQMWIMVLIYTFTLFKIVFFYPDDSSKTLKRPCLFCGKFLAKLKRHLISNHSKEEEVSNALKLPKHLQNRQFAKMRKAGIFKVNAEKMKSEEKINEVYLIRERNHGEGALTICLFCKESIILSACECLCTSTKWTWCTKGFEDHTIQSRSRVLYCRQRF